MTLPLSRRLMEFRVWEAPPSPVTSIYLSLVTYDVRSTKDGPQIVVLLSDQPAGGGASARREFKNSQALRQFITGQRAAGITIDCSKAINRIVS